MKNNSLDVFWDAVNSSHWRDALEIACPNDLESIKLWSESLSLREVEAYVDDDFTRSELNKLGIKPEYFCLARIDTYDNEIDRADLSKNNLLRNTIERVRSIDKDNDLIHVDLKGMRESVGAFQVEMFVTGKMSLICPFTGKLLFSQHCCPIALDPSRQAYLLYRFESVEVFYVCVGNFYANKIFLYLPKSGSILLLQSKRFVWWILPPIVMALASLIAIYRKEFVEYLGSSTRRALLLNVMENLGHAIWNDAAGLDQAVSARLAHEIDQGLSYRHRYVDAASISGLSLCIHEANTPNELARLAFTEKLFCIKPTAIKFNGEFADRVCESASKKCSADFCDLVARARGCKYLFWFNLRVHNKSCQNNLEILNSVLSCLDASEQEIGILFDGTPDCTELLRDLRAGLSPGIKVFDGLHLTMDESIVFAKAVDFYIATIGSGLSIVSWIAQKPGVAHSEHSHLHQMRFWGDVQPDAPRPLSPSFDDVTELGNGAYCSYTIDPESVAVLVRSITNA